MTRTAVAVLVLGALPFCAMGLAFGYLFVAGWAYRRVAGRTYE